MICILTKRRRASLSAKQDYCDFFKLQIADEYHKYIPHNTKYYFIWYKMWDERALPSVVRKRRLSLFFQWAFRLQSIYIFVTKVEYTF